MYDIIISKSAEKYIDKLNNKDRNRIIKSLDKLKTTPELFLIKLVNYNIYKFRVGNYRLLIDFYKNELRIVIIEIGLRKNIYKKLK